MENSYGYFQHKLNPSGKTLHSNKIQVFVTDTLDKFL